MSYRAQEADLLIIMFDASTVLGLPCDRPISMHNFVTNQLHQLGFKVNVSSNEEPHFADIICTKENIPVDGATSDIVVSLSNTLVVFNKLDLHRDKTIDDRLTDHSLTCCGISCVTEEGIDQFLEHFKDKVEKL